MAKRSITQNSASRGISVTNNGTGEVEIRGSALAGWNGNTRTYYGTTEGTRPAYYVKDTRTAMRCPCEDCDAIPHTRHVMLLSGSSGPDTLILGECEGGHEFGGFFEDHSGQTSGEWFLLTHMDCVLDSLVMEIKDLAAEGGGE